MSRLAACRMLPVGARNIQTQRGVCAHVSILRRTSDMFSSHPAHHSCARVCVCMYVLVKRDGHIDHGLVPTLLTCIVRHWMVFIDDDAVGRKRWLLP